MNKKIIYIVVLLCIACGNTDPKTYSAKMTGYWEIQKVITSQGITKEYNYNQTIDYIEVNNELGIRKKLQPQLNGSFISTKDTEKFTLKIEQDSLRMYYETPLSTWKETVISVKEEEMIIQNEDGNLYFYSPYQKIDFTDGKTTE